jgi:hypothetical protein
MLNYFIEKIKKILDGVHNNGSKTLPDLQTSSQADAPLLFPS